MNNDQNNQNTWSNNEENVTPSVEQNSASVWDTGSVNKSPEQGIWESQSIIGNQINIDDKVEQQPVSTPTNEEIDPNLLSSTAIDSNALSNKKPFAFNKIISMIIFIGVIGALIFFALSLINKNKEYQDRKKVATSSSVEYIESIKEYVYKMNSNSKTIGIVAMPTLTGSTVDCYTVDGKNWYGKVDSKSTTCNEFMNAIENNNTPQEAYIMFGLKGEIISGSWLKYKGVYCIYDGDKISDYSKKQPISIPSNEIEEANAKVDDSTDPKKSSGSSSVDAIVSSKESTAKSSALGFVDTIEYYIGFAQANTDDMSLGDYDPSLIPQEDTVCTKVNGSWTTCTELMNKIETKLKGASPEEAKIKLNSSGLVLDGTWMKYNEYYCLYTNNNITNCSKNKID